MNDSEVISHASSFGYGGMSEPELKLLMGVCRGKKVLELGSMVGMSSYVIASVCDSLNCVDVWSDNQEHLSHDSQQCDVYKALAQKIPNMYSAFISNCKEFIDSGKIIVNRGNTSEIVGKFKNKSFDIILFDADHSYFGVSTDFNNYQNKLKDDGIFLFHDYNDGMWTSIVVFCKEMIDNGKIVYVSNVERLAVFKNA